MIYQPSFLFAFSTGYDILAMTFDDIDSLNNDK